MTGDSVDYIKQNCKGWRGLAKVLDKESQSVLIRQGGAFYWMHPCNLLKVNKELGSPRNDKNNISSNEVNIILEKKMKNNKGPNSKSEKLKYNTEKPCRKAVVECKMNGSEEWKKGKIMGT